MLEWTSSAGDPPPRLLPPQPPIGAQAHTHTRARAHQPPHPTFRATHPLTPPPSPPPLIPLPASPHASPRRSALAEDHINDVASNLGAMLAAGVVKVWPAGWWVDPVAAIVIALVILARWTAITHAQVRPWGRAPGAWLARAAGGGGRRGPAASQPCATAGAYVEILAQLLGLWRPVNTTV